MVKVFVLFAMVLVCLFAVSCSEKKAVSEEVTIRLSADSLSVVVTGLNRDLLRELAEHDSVPEETFQSVFAVFPESDDETLVGLERPLAGKYSVAKGDLQFRPDPGFVKGTRYRAEVRVPAYYSLKSTPTQHRMPGSMETKSVWLEL